MLKQNLKTNNHTYKCHSLLLTGYKMQEKLHYQIYIEKGNIIGHLTSYPNFLCSLPLQDSSYFYEIASAYASLSTKLKTM